MELFHRPLGVNDGAQIVLHHFVGEGVLGPVESRYAGEVVRV